tara:strand:+ start:1091 stop:1753 length:663 start_codon:yes stop_codon:yes gene_type:complete
LIIGLVGWIGSGKNTVADILSSQHNYKKDSFAAPLKDVTANIFNWPRKTLEGDTDHSRHFRECVDPYWANKLQIKNFTPRLALQIVGTELFREHFHPKIWLDSLEHRYIASGSTPTVITDCRFRNELAFVKQMGGFTIRVKRGEDPHWTELAKQAQDGDAFAEQQLADIGIHASEWDHTGVLVDFIIENNGTLEQLHDKIKSVAKVLSNVSKEKKATQTF